MSLYTLRYVACDTSAVMRKDKMA